MKKQCYLPNLGSNVKLENVPVFKIMLMQIFPVFFFEQIRKYEDHKNKE